MDSSNIAVFIRNNFNREVEFLRELPSYEDRNFLFEDTSLKHELLVLKVLCERPNQNECALKQQLNSRIDCVRHIRKGGFKCSEFVKGNNGHYVQDSSKVILNKDGSTQQPSSFALLFSFLPGKELEHTGYIHNSNIIFQVGAFLGCFHKAFEGFDADASLDPDPHDAWYMCNYDLLARGHYMNCIEDTAIRQKLFSLLKYIKEELDPVKEFLQKGIIHGDFQGLNIIVSKDFDANSKSLNFLDGDSDSNFASKSSNSCCRRDFDVDPPTTEIISNLKSNQKQLNVTELKKTFGLIDFEDVSHSYIVLELGRAIADAMVTFLAKTESLDTCEETVGQSSGTTAGSSMAQNETKHIKSPIKSEVFKIGGWMISGYLSTNDLISTEYKVVLSAVLISLCQYYILGSQAMQENPDNCLYVGYCSQEALVLLEWLHDTPPQEVYRIWSDSAHDFIANLNCN